jgi:hypothetical protein
MIAMLLPIFGARIELVVRGWFSEVAGPEESDAASWLNCWLKRTRDRNGEAFPLSPQISNVDRMTTESHLGSSILVNEKKT